jgi:phospholipase D1/2
MRATERTPGHRLRGPLVGFVVVATVILLGYVVRSSLAMDLSAAGIQRGVARLGWYGPVVFFALTTFRQFLAIPSWLILAAGGLCFGTVAGTALGGGALVASGCLKFGIARWVGRDWVREHFGAPFARLERHVDRLGPVVIGLSTAHPLGVLSPFHWAAGLSSIRFASFAGALVLGAPVRAFAYSAFGAALADPGAPAFRTVSLGLAALALLPLALPGVRRRLFG